MYIQILLISIKILIDLGNFACMDMYCLLENCFLFTRVKMYGWLNAIAIEMFYDWKNAYLVDNFNPTIHHSRSIISIPIKFTLSRLSQYCQLQKRPLSLNFKRSKGFFSLYVYFLDDQTALLSKWMPLAMPT